MRIEDQDRPFYSLSRCQRASYKVERVLDWVRPRFKEVLNECNNLQPKKVCLVIKKVFPKGSLIGLLGLIIANVFSSGYIDSRSIFNLCSFVLSGILIYGLYRAYRDSYEGQRIEIPCQAKVPPFIKKVILPGSILGLTSLAVMNTFFSVAFLSIFNICNSMTIGIMICILYRANRDLYHGRSIRFS